MGQRKWGKSLTWQWDQHQFLHSAPSAVSGCLSAVSPLFQFLRHEMGLIRSLWTLQRFCRFFEAFTKVGVKVRTYEETQDNF